MRENSKEFVMYESFDELPDELKEKFKSGDEGASFVQIKSGYVNFINLLGKHGDRLTGLYVNNNTKTQVEFGKCGHIADIRPSTYKNGGGCGVCDGKQVQQGVNDLTTTHPHLVKYFVNVGDVYTHTHGSNKKVELKCPECGYIKMMSILNLARHAYSCDICSDGISYPEKLMASILTKLNIEFVKQMSYDKGKHKYDFYLPKYNAILETHGLQHYEQQGRGRSLEQEQENDRYKRVLAIENGILNNNYHEIDCRCSTMEWCKHGIEEVLSRYVDIDSLTDNDWKEADIQAQKSLKIEVCKYWKDSKEMNGDLTTTQVANVFGVSNITVGNYLKWGSKNDLCNYNDHEVVKTRNKRRNGTFVYLVKPNGDKWFENAVSMRELARATGIAKDTIAGNLDKEALKYHHSAKYDPKYIGSRIVSAEVYDNQTQSS